MTTEQLEKIREYASLMLTVEEIALQMDLDEDQLREQINTKGHIVARTYHLGKLETKIEHNRLVLNFAKKGSPQAEKLAVEYMRNQRKSEL